MVLFGLLFVLSAVNLAGGFWLAVCLGYGPRSFRNMWIAIGIEPSPDGTAGVSPEKPHDQPSSNAPAQPTP
jgi:hypothetical protein